MALSEKHRSSISQRLVPILGDEEAQVRVSQFPVTDLETPATKDFVRAEVAELRAELHRHTAWTIGTLSGVVVTAVTIAQLIG